MSGNIFGDQFKVMTFGESHGPCMGCVIEGCPPGLYIDEAFIQNCLDERRPGKNAFVTPRNEPDKLELISGVYNGISTGAPLAFLVKNQNFDSKPYQRLAQVYRPGHANYTYLEKYGIFDPRGGGRASARETVARVIAGAVAMLYLQKQQIEIEVFLKSVGPIQAHVFDQNSSDILCFDKTAEIEMKAYLQECIQEGDSVGGVVGCIIKNVPSGLGDPVFDRFEAKLGYAMLSIPATKGFAIGEGFHSATMRGSEFNDLFYAKNQSVALKTNHSGGTLGGITTGQEITFEVAFKPTSSIKKIKQRLILISILLN